jgi:hypothetical protein
MTHMAWESIDRMAIFDAYAAVPLITRPLHPVQTGCRS